MLRTIALYTFFFIINFFSCGRIDYIYSPCSITRAPLLSKTAARTSDKVINFEMIFWNGLGARTGGGEVGRGISIFLVFFGGGGFLFFCFGAPGGL